MLVKLNSDANSHAEVVPKIQLIIYEWYIFHFLSSNFLGCCQLESSKEKDRDVLL